MAAIHLIATTFMAGVIVFVQVVHYPLMDAVGAREFSAFEKTNVARTGWVVIPPMLIELGSALWLVWMPPTPALQSAAWLGAALLAVIWLSTAFLQAPAHRRLLSGFDATVHRRLVRTNWIRTVAWLGRVPIALYLLVG